MMIVESTVCLFFGYTNDCVERTAISHVNQWQMQTTKFFGVLWSSMASDKINKTNQTICIFSLMENTTCW